MGNVIDALRTVLPTYEDEQDKNALRAWAVWCFWVAMVVLAIDGAGIFFMELDITKTVKLFQSMYWFPMLFAAAQMAVAQILLRTVGMTQSEKDKRAKRKKAKET